MEIVDSKYNYNVKYMYIDNNNELDIDYYNSTDYSTLDKCEASIETYINKLKEGEIDNVYKLLGYIVNITLIKVALIDNEIWTRFEDVRDISNIDKLSKHELELFNT